MFDHYDASGLPVACDKAEAELRELRADDARWEETVGDLNEKVIQLTRALARAEETAAIVWWVCDDSGENHWGRNALWATLDAAKTYATEAYLAEEPDDEVTPDQLSWKLREAAKGACWDLYCDNSMTYVEIWRQDVRGALALAADASAAPCPCALANGDPCPDHDTPAASEPECGSCGGDYWVDDENWQPERWELQRGRIPGSGRIPCGICNHGGWNVPDGNAASPSGAVACGPGDINEDPAAQEADAPAASVPYSAVWIAAARREIDYHTLTGDLRRTSCGRSAQAGGVILARADAVQRYAARPCPRCEPGGGQP